MRLSIEKVIEYMSTISFSDLLFFCALLVLIALILILIFMLKKGTYYVEVKEPIKKEEQIKKEEPIKETEEKDAPLDLQALTKALENATPKAIELTPYEEEQEEKAIISYDELLQARKDFKLQYDDEQEEEGVLVKKVDLGQLSKDTLSIQKDVEQVLDEPKLEETKEAIVISYEKEEAFLEALKQLQMMLNE